MSRCKYCKKDINIFKNFFNSGFCSDICSKNFEIEEKKIMKEELYKKYIKEENVTNEIKEKYFKLNNIYEEKDLLLYLINEWKKIQDKRLKIINIETWKWEGKSIEQCEPWEAKIFYTFEV